MVDTANAETAPQEDLKNNGTNTDTQTGNGSDNADVEQLRKNAEKAEMRARQAENEARKLKELQEKQEQKRLEEQEEWKSLAEQRQAKLDELETAEEERQRKAKLSTAETELFGEFSDDVVELVKEAGIGLQDDSDESKQRLQTTLKKFSEKLSGQNKPQASNPNTPAQKARTTEELLLQHAKSPNPALIDEAIGNLQWIQSHKPTE